MYMYRSSFKPSKVLDKPHAMVGLNIIAADTDQEAERLATTLQQQFLNLMRGKETPLQPPVDNINDIAGDYEVAVLENQLGTSIVGNPQIVKEKLEKFLDESQADEIMAIAQVYDHKARLRSCEILAEIFELK